MPAPARRRRTFAEVDDAIAYLTEHGFRRFSTRTWFSRRTGETARWDHAGNGSVALTLI